MNIDAHLKHPRTVVLAAAAVILAWLVVSQSFGAFLADAAPQAALWVDPQQPQALVNLAEQTILAPAVAQETVDSAAAPSLQGNSSDSGRQAADGGAPPKQHFDHAFSAFVTIDGTQSYNRTIAPENEAEVRDWLITALRNDPLNPRALRILGQLADANSEDADAWKFMHAASSLSLHDNVAVYWLMRNAVRASDFKSVVYYADVLLRTNPQSAPYVAPILARISGDKAGAELVETVLAGNPPWRSDFLWRLPNNVSDARTPLDLLLALKDGASPPTVADIASYINFLIAHEFYSLAYYTWLQFLPPDDLGHAGLLFNGNFEAPPSGLPFDWTIRPGSGVTIDVVPRPDKSGGHALMIDFQFGRVDYHSVTELVMLAPGTYQFSGQYKGELIGPRGLKWRVVCANRDIQGGGESPMINGISKDWKDVSFTFTVPDTGCDAQYVRLDFDARMASEQLISGSILFDELQISRVTSPSSGG